MDEKRLVAFLISATLIMFTVPAVMNWLWPPPPRPAPAKVAAKAEALGGDRKKAGSAAPAEKPAAAAAAPAKEPFKANEPAAALPEPPLQPRITIGSTRPGDGYRLRLTLSNHGAVVRSIELADFLDEQRGGKLPLLSSDGDLAGSFGMDLNAAGTILSTRNWNVSGPVAVHDAQGDGQRMTFDSDMPELGIEVIKTYTVRKGHFDVQLDIELRNRRDREQSISYRLGGPRGTVLEGTWFARKLRDATIGAEKGNQSVSRGTQTAAALVKQYKKRVDEYLARDTDRDGLLSPNEWEDARMFERFDADRSGRLSPNEVFQAACFAAGESSQWTELPARLFAGVEAQYFATILIPDDAPGQNQMIAKVTPVLASLGDDPGRPELADPSVELESKPVVLAAHAAARHRYTIYAGPRTREDVMAVVPHEPTAHAILDYGRFGAIARFMVGILRFFHGWVHNWGIAVILLTVLVRLSLFPLSRRQAIAAQLMQEKMTALKPELDKLREKHKPNSSEFAHAQMELFRKHGVNPLGQLAGCLPVLLQMPIFIGLWQGVSGAVELRQAPFVLWIDNLAAPDALFPFGFSMPVLGPYFNLLPFLVVGLMIAQQKMFMPPPTDPQQEAQQRMMMIMLVVMSVMFYQVPSGLCLYITASTLWGLAERMLLPKKQALAATVAPAARHAADGKRKPQDSPNGRGSVRSLLTRVKQSSWGERVARWLEQARKR